MTRTKLSAAAIAVMMLATGSATAVSGDTQPLAPLERLASHCWKGEFAEGGSWDRHCFQWAYDGKFLHDEHVVTGKRAPYGGETWYRFDGASRRIVFHYFNSMGGYSEGHVEPAQNELRFPEERYEQGGKSQVLRTVWRFEGETRMVAVTEQRNGDKWAEAWRVTFLRE